MPAAPIQPMAGLPSLTSSELYTQTLAAQADVLVAAKAWPLLTKSLADLTDIPGRQQLAIGASEGALPWEGNSGAKYGVFVSAPKNAQRTRQVPKDAQLLEH